MLNIEIKHAQIKRNNMNSVILNLFLTLIFGAGFNLYAADQPYVPYCVRLYCINDSSTKIRNERGHSKIFPVHYDAKYNVYLIHSTLFKSALKQCGRYERFRALRGSNAAINESLALRLKILTSWKSFNADLTRQECIDLEK